MDDLVAVAVKIDTGEIRYFITYGRVQHTVEPETLEAIVLQHSPRFDLGGTPLSARVCWSLQEAAGQPYFYEALFDSSLRGISHGEEYETWRRRIDIEMRDGRHLHYLGRKFEPSPD